MAYKTNQTSTVCRGVWNLLQEFNIYLIINSQNKYFNQLLGSRAPKSWSKCTTNMYSYYKTLLSSILFQDNIKSTQSIEFEAFQGKSIEQWSQSATYENKIDTKSLCVQFPNESSNR